MKLRGYQNNAHDCVFKEWETHRSTLLVAATGCGKTVIFAHVIKSLAPKRVIVICHRNELILQAKEKIEAITGLPVAIEKADQYAGNSLWGAAPIVVASVQTLISGAPGKRRYLRFNPRDFGALIADEAHHALSLSWRESIDYFLTNPELKVLGCTATPDRTDKKALGQLFESVAFTYDILDAIQDGYLVDITQQFVAVKTLDLSAVRTTAGDLNEGDLARIMEMEENVHGICQPSLEAMFALQPKTLDAVQPGQWKEYLTALNRQARRTIIFTVSVAQAEMCANVFRRAMPGEVEWVCGATQREKRQTMLNQFATGEVQCMVNCGVLTEGFDNPAVEMIVMARPTKSRALYAQCVGRSTRPLPGLVDGIETAEERRKVIEQSPKPFCRILDFVGNSGRHKLMTCADILGGKVSEEAVEQAKKLALKDGTPKRILVTMTNAQLNLERQKRKAEEHRRQQEEERKKRVLFRSEFAMRDVDPFNGPVLREERPRMSIDGRPFSPKQYNLLVRNGYQPTQLRYGAGRAIIGKLFEKNGWGKKKGVAA